jgi:hypothetical protein
MVDRIESSDHATGPDAPETAEDTNRPNHVPEKFWDAEKGEVRTEDLLKSYSELEKKSSSGLPSDDGKDDPKPAEGDDPNPDDGDVAEKAAEAAGVDMDALETEFMAEGKLTDKSYADLEAKGFSREEVDDFIQYRAQKSDRYMGELYSEVGGEEQFATMAKWASENWSADELKEYNDAVDSYEMGRAKLAMKGLRADYEKANGRAPKLLDGDGSPAKGGTIYRSDAEMQRDMQDPRYREDPAFRDDVIKKVDRSMKHYGQA